MTNYGGIVLAGGNATRLYPSTQSVNKHLLPVYDKPMIYYSMSILLSSGISDLTIVCKESDIEDIKRVIGNERYLGININFAIQNEPKGLPHAIYEGFQKSLQSQNLVVLGDNFIFGSEFFTKVHQDLQNYTSSTIYLKNINNYSHLGVALINEKKEILDFVEKPNSKNHNYKVITGLYKFTNLFLDAFEDISPSKRNEYEIVDIFKYQNNLGFLNYIEIGRGTTWYDVGTYDDLNSCSNFVREVQNKQKMLVCSPHEIAFTKGLITEKEFKEYIQNNKFTDYGKLLAENTEFLD